MEILETSFFKGNVSRKKLEGIINDVTMTRDGWELSKIFIDDRRKFLIFSKKTVFIVFKKRVV